MLREIKAASIVIQCSRRVWSESWMTVWPHLDPAASLLPSQEQMCVGYFSVKSSTIATWLVVARSGAAFVPLHGTQVWRPSA